MIQGIIAGNGTETEAGPVSERQIIVSTINGHSCTSSGGHVYFIVSSNGITQNPFTYLKLTDSINCSGLSCESSDGDSINCSGSWILPVEGAVTLFQGYGYTWANRDTDTLS